jgi:MOSC domain-containing protein YiiM
VPSGRLEAINVSRGGIPKTSVLEALITEYGVDGDHQNDLRYHGGPDRAVSIYSLDVIRALQGEGHPIEIGTAGENLTVSGLDWAALTPGQELRVGPVHLRLTKYASPCENIRRSFIGENFTRISQKLHPGWSRMYARVLTGGVVRPGDPVEIVQAHQIDAALKGPRYNGCA